MTIRSRSLVSNSLSSLVSSGLLIFSTVLVPAVLVRAISRPEFNLLSTVLATLPLLSIIPQSLRGVAPSQLALAYGQVEQWLATRAFLRFSVLVALGLATMSVVGMEIYIRFDTAHNDQVELFRFGLYCIAGHALGLIAIGLFSGPAGARQDFLPENFAKLWPGLYHLAGIALIWLVSPATPLIWIFLVYLSSSWTAAAILALRHCRSVYGGSPAKKEGGRHDEVEKLFWSSLRGTTWWNATAYLATSSAIIIVSLQHPDSIVPYSIATSFLGIVSAGLIAVASPIAGYAVIMRDRSSAERRRFFLIVNTLFQTYIIATAVVVLLIPQQLFALWVKPELAIEVRFFCTMLLPASVLRMLTMAFTVFVTGAGRQETIWLSPLIEAGLSVVCCLVLGRVIGVTGIPLGLTISAAIRLVLTVVHDERISMQALCLHRGDTLLSGLRWRRAT